ncbi:DUF1715-domain-containing protein [Neolentinus lepideus HHB14362 ss-1]|uniref:DUF1715-domain-containing protein n=1 Tax=Neolentinus lepideus HHB14362 ss-1 TaxID=1314782 RepID=A0A165VUE7_9AGAM|nr:DUF1715-domain-containing protein [Neolentinus lepideus HHB14362 ss-1]
MADFDLESLVHLEQTFYDDGYKDGFTHGRIHGLIEGRALGREKGFEMWEELGFYEGFAVIWKAVYVRQGRQDDRGFHHINQLLDLISQFPTANPSVETADVDISKLFRQIRSRYKALCATLGVKSSLRANASSSISAEEDIPEPPQNVGSGHTVWELSDAAKVKAKPGQDLSF